MAIGSVSGCVICSGWPKLRFEEGFEVGEDLRNIFGRDKIQKAQFADRIGHIEQGSGPLGLSFDICGVFQWWIQNYPGSVNFLAAIWPSVGTLTCQTNPTFSSIRINTPPGSICHHFSPTMAELGKA